MTLFFSRGLSDWSEFLEIILRTGVVTLLPFAGDTTDSTSDSSDHTERDEATRAGRWNAVPSAQASRCFFFDLTPVLSLVWLAFGDGDGGGSGNDTCFPQSGHFSDSDLHEQTRTFSASAASQLRVRCCSGKASRMGPVKSANDCPYSMSVRCICTLSKP